MVEINNTTAQKINRQQTEKIVTEFLRVYKKSAYTVSVAVVGSARMRKLNDDYRGIDKTTDVLSFSDDNNKGRMQAGNSASRGNATKYLGEVIMNIDEVKKANKYIEVFGVKKSAEYIFNFLLVHGLLHLVGYRDDQENERLEMINLGKEFLRKYS